MAKGKRSETSQSGPAVQKKSKDEIKGKKTTVAKFNKPAPPVPKSKKTENAAVVEKQRDNTWSKSKKKRMRRLKSKLSLSKVEESDISPSKAPKKSRDKKREKSEKSSAVSSKPPSEKAALLPDEDDDDDNNVASPAPSSTSKPLNSKMQGFMERLKGSRFRELNEELYTTTSSSSLDRFSKNPELYQQYHDGFRHQVEAWPVNPVDVIVQWLTRKYKTSRQPVVIADFGCGDAALAKELLKVRHDGKCPFQVHSFDLVASCELVTACDMSNTPLLDQSVDVGIFCLALMGTNLADFIREAHRVLKPKGILKIAEVRSRFAAAGQKKEDDALPEFTKVLEQLGFACRQTDRSNKMFVVLELEKNGKTPNPTITYTAKPCLYKRR